MTPTNTTSTGPEWMERWISYLNAAGFLAPGIFFWAFAENFLLPKLKVIWLHGGGPASDSQWLMVSLGTLMRNDAMALGAILVGLVLLEWLLKPWARFRRTVLGTLVFLLNTTVMLGLTAICVAALKIAPALISLR